MDYQTIYRRSVEDPSAFWMEAARSLDWDDFPETAYAPETDIWFPDGRLNLCRNAVDRHVSEGHGDRPALIYESPVTGRSETYSFAELRDQVAQTAGMIAAAGAARGDRVIIYMPMIPEAVFAMLACARLGVVHSVVFGGFSAPELAKRIDDCEPVLLLSASCGVEGSRVIAYKPMIDEAVARARSKPRHAIIVQRPELPADLTPPFDLSWEEQFDGAAPADCVPVRAQDPLYILYTSGTTGKPKGVVRDTGGYGVALQWSMGNIYGARPGEAFWAASDIGWVVGHSYIVYGPLLNGNATILFEGKPVGTPDAGIFWRIVERHAVRTLFTAPTAIRAIRASDPDAKLLDAVDGLQLRALFLAGERADPDTLEWIAAKLDRPVIDHWWQTELGWPAIATCLGLGEGDMLAGSAGRAVPGYGFAVLDDDGAPVPNGEVANLTIERPLPPGCFRALWKNEAGYAACFGDFPGHYATGDAGKCDPDGHIHVMGRTDDIINVAGHRLSTGQIEEVVAACEQVVECAVVGGRDAVKGTIPIVFYVSGAEAAEGQDYGWMISQAVRGAISPIAAPKACVRVEKLPKTRSGKILRNVLRAIADGETPRPPETIEDIAVIDDIIAAWPRKA
ncbi:MAG: AMP-binding protein [Pseudomonadota bacterium]